ncbi:MAG: hypothetical protein EBS99_17335, partial [Betaproteobacteria bacterium]|nr:hypothetical protein [Betaproteobacteria bacterium]
MTVPINTRFRSDELGYCLKQADIRCLIFVDRFLGIDFCALLQDIVPTLPQLQCALMLGDGPCPDWAQRLEDKSIPNNTSVPAAVSSAVSDRLHDQTVLRVVIRPRMEEIVGGSRSGGHGTRGTVSAGLPHGKL